MQNNLSKKLIIDFKKSFKKLKLDRAENVYVTSNLTSIANLRIPKKDKLSIILNSLKSVMGKNYTIFSPSASMNLCNTKFVFDLKKTPSYQMGPLAEFIRTQKNSTRSHFDVEKIPENSIRSDFEVENRESLARSHSRFEKT